MNFPLQKQNQTKIKRCEENMPYIVSRSEYPAHLAAEVGKIYLKILQKFPPDPSIGEAVVPAAVNITSTGIVAIGITLVKEGKLEEAWNRAVEARALSLEVEGLESSIEVWGTAQEALKAINM